MAVARASPSAECALSRRYRRPSSSRTGGGDPAPAGSTSWLPACTGAARREGSNRRGRTRCPRTQGRSGRYAQREPVADSRASNSPITSSKRGARLTSAAETPWILVAPTGPHGFTRVAHSSTTRPNPSVEITAISTTRSRDATRPAVSTSMTAKPPSGADQAGGAPEAVVCNGRLCGSTRCTRRRTASKIPTTGLPLFANAYSTSTRARTRPSAPSIGFRTQYSNRYGPSRCVSEFRQYDTLDYEASERGARSDLQAAAVCAGASQSV